MAAKRRAQVEARDVAEARPMISARFFAVPDPLRPGAMSYWSRTKNGETVPWPKRHNRWDHAVIPASEVPSEGFADWWAQERFREEYAARHADRVRAALDTVNAAIDADPFGAATSFALHFTVCFCCGKTLTDAQSKAYGVGPECIRNFTDNERARLIEITARMHGESAVTAPLLDDEARETRRGK